MCGVLELPETNPLFMYLHNREWEKAKKEAKKNKLFVKQSFKIDGFFEDKISSRVNPIHLACRIDAPPQVVESLLEIYPDGAEQGDSKYGRLPLHAAVMNGASTKLVNLLLKERPMTASVKDLHGRIALHYAAKDEINGERNTRQLIRAFPEGCSVSDASGFLPLHVACRCGAPVPTIRMLIRACPDSIHAKTQKGSTCFAFAQKIPGVDLQEQVMGLLKRLAEEQNDKETKMKMSASTSNGSFSSLSSQSSGHTASSALSVSHSFKSTI